MRCSASDRGEWVAVAVAYQILVRDVLVAEGMTVRDSDRGAGS